MADKWMLDDQIQHNKRATVWLFFILFVIAGVVIYAVGLVLGAPPLFTAPIAIIGSLIYLAIASGFSIQAILNASGARKPDTSRREEKLYVYKVEEMALAAGIPVPAAYVQDSPDINAFATGRKPEEGIICVTTGALQKLDNEELEGVIAHEMSHILNLDIRIQTYSIALIGMIAMIAEIVLRSLFWGGGNRKVHPAMIIIGIVLLILAPLFSRMAHMAISRRREYLADATGAKLTRNPEGLASALAKIGASEPTQKRRGDKTVASLYLANPFKRTRRESVWASHPPIDSRIERLRQM